jgi:hypothetical protein
MALISNKRKERKKEINEVITDFRVFMVVNSCCEHSSWGGYTMWKWAKFLKFQRYMLPLSSVSKYAGCSACSHPRAEFTSKPE